MPSGLPDVTQRFDADTAGYLAGVAAMIKANKDLVDDIRKVKWELGGLGLTLAGLPDKRIKVEVTGIDEALAKIDTLKSALDSLGDKHVSIGGDNAAMLRELRDISASMDQVSSSLGRMEDHMVVMKRDLADSSADLQMQTQILRDNASAHSAAADAVNALAAAHRSAGDRYYIRTGGGGGGGRGGAAAVTGGGELPGGRGAFIPWAGGGFQAVKFWGMAIAEFAATAVPAIIAAGAAAAVSMEGAQQLQNRAKAIFTVSSALGDALGTSAGQFIGTGSAFAQYQQQAVGGVYELAGAGIRFAGMGGGQFGQMGLNTLAMIDRGTANALINYQARQKAGRGLMGLMGGGTEWLRRYGDLGANIGNAIMNLAPYEPGIGGDVLNTLVGGTGLLSRITQDVPGGLLGAIMAVEGGGRWGKALLGGKGLLGRVLGLGRVGGVGGLISKGGEAIATRGLGGILGDLGLGMMGAGDFLATAGGPVGDVAALSAYTMAWLASTMPSPAMRQMAALQAGVGKAGFTGAWQPLAHAITVASGLAAQAPTGIASMMGTMQGPASFARFGPIGPTTQQVYAAGAQGFMGQMTDLLRAGPQLVSVLHQAGLKSVTMAQAFQIAQNSLLDLGHAFDAHSGKLNKTSQQMLKNYVSAIGPMTQSGGAFGAAIAAQQIMASPAMQDLSKVNQAMDSMTQIMTGGPVGMATLFGMLGGTPVTRRPTRGGMQLSVPPAYARMAQALTSFITPGGAAAWQTFAGPQGLITAEQQNLDQLRTALTLGALGQGQAAGLAGFQLQQMLPMARRSPAALAMLMQQGAQMGVTGYYDPSKTQAQNYQAAVNAMGKVADNARQANAATNQMAVNLSRLPQVAQQFSQSMNADVMSQRVAQAAQDMVKIQDAAKVGKIDTSGIKDWVAQLQKAGVTARAIGPMLDNALRQAGVGAAMRKKIEIQVAANVGQAQAAINSVHGKTVNIPAHSNIGQIQAAINAVRGKTVVIDIVQHYTVTGTPMGALGTIRTVSPTGSVGSLGGHTGSGMQTGGLVPGSGSGDIIPSMLEPGEVVIPRSKVAALAPMLTSLGIPGFGRSGVSTMGGVAHFAGGGVVPHRVLKHIEPWGPMDWTLTGHEGQLPLPAYVNKILDQLLKEVSKSGIWKQFGTDLTGHFASTLKGLVAETGRIARGLVGKITQEVGYAKGVSDAAMYGQGYDPSGKGAGIFGGMDVTPGTGSGTVQEQLQSYVGTVKSFSGDIRTLRKQHLNKAILQQLIAAGPVQGDALAQSILNDYGGVKGVNQLWSQLGVASKGLGAQAAMGVYGGYLSSDLKHGTFNFGGVHISINAKGGTTLALTPQQIKQLVEEIQAALLKQARRNQKTGIQANGKGA